MNPLNKKAILFAGTTEGRLLAERFYREQIPCTVCVATGYGAQMSAEWICPDIRIGRLDAGQMAALIVQERAAVVIDATHPFAVEATKNIKDACRQASCPYLRLLRRQTDARAAGDDHNQIYFPDILTAARFLECRTGNLFLTTGSKELGILAREISDLSRIYVRILPSVENLQLCQDIGLKGRQIFCMQGPFSVMLNEAMLKHCRAQWMVTKESGAEGGFLEKCRAAENARAACAVIQRPQEEGGFSMDEVWEKLQEYV